MKIKTLQLVFENCETVKIYGEDIALIDYAIKKERNLGVGGQVTKMKYLSDLQLVLHQDANGLDEGIFTDNKNIFDRIREYNDITTVVITTASGKEKTYHIDFAGNDSMNNERQSSSINESGCLHITIKDDVQDEKKVEDINGDNSDYCFESVFKTSDILSVYCYYNDLHQRVFIDLHVDPHGYYTSDPEMLYDSKFLSALSDYLEQHYPDWYREE